MGTGYTRQSAAEIQTGEVIEAAPINAEFNQLQNAFDSTIGHTHDGTVGEGPKINLTSSVTGVLPVANGGSGGINKVDATTAPLATDDSNDGYAVGSLWIDVTNDVVYICVDATPTAAIWQRYQLYDLGLTSIAALTTAANKMIYTTGSDVYATTDLTAYARTILDDTDAATARGTLGLGTIATQNSGTVSITGGTITGITDLAVADGGTGASTAGSARTNLGLGTIATQDANNVTITGGSVAGITDLAVADGGTGASTAANARTNLGLVIGTDVEAHDTTLTALAAYNANGLLTQTAADTFAGRTLTGTANEVTVTNGSGVSGNPTVSLPSAITLTGKTVTGGTFASTEGVSLVSTDAGATVGPSLDVYRDSASPAAADVIGSVDFNGRDSAANKQLYGRIQGTIVDPVSGTEDATITIQTVANGAIVNTAVFTGVTVTINGTLTVTG